MTLAWAEIGLWERDALSFHTSRETAAKERRDSCRLGEDKKGSAAHYPPLEGEGGPKARVSGFTRSASGIAKKVAPFQLASRPSSRRYTRFALALVPAQRVETAGRVETDRAAQLDATSQIATRSGQKRSIIG